MDAIPLVTRDSRKLFHKETTMEKKPGTVTQQAEQSFEKALQAYLDGQGDSNAQMEIALVQLDQAGITNENWIGKGKRLDEAGMPRTAIEFLRKARDDHEDLKALALKYHDDNPALALRAWICITKKRVRTQKEKNTVLELIETLKPQVVNRDDIARICDGYESIGDFESMARYQDELFASGKAHYAKFVRSRLPEEERAELVAEELVR